MSSYRFTTRIKEDHTILLPEEIPQGLADVLVVVKEEGKNGCLMPLRGLPYRFEDPFSPALSVQDWDACQ